MKSTTRGTLAAAVAGVAAAVGVATATPAAAVGTVPVPVPLGGAETALGTKLPEVGGELPVPTTGTPEAPRFVRGRLLPESVVPRVPVHGGLPGLDARVPLAHLLDDGFDHVSVDAPASDVRALAPGLSADGPLTAPKPGSAGLPGLKLPELDVLGPVLQTAPTTDLTAGPGL
ncbi:hypothetical protein [Streptomyces sp. MK5]|uniref:hypothetical protein n=1 Tax=Streptomyces sp. MK5 TaxID=3064253 RepID=UPI0027403358|nr:hypothetical protein [Streptomyces sp. MK5]